MNLTELINLVERDSYDPNAALYNMRYTPPSAIEQRFIERLNRAHAQRVLLRLAHGRRVGDVG